MNMLRCKDKKTSAIMWYTLEELILHVLDVDLESDFFKIKFLRGRVVELLVDVNDGSKELNYSDLISEADFDRALLSLMRHNYVEFDEFDNEFYVRNNKELYKWMLE